MLLRYFIRSRQLLRKRVIRFTFFVSLAIVLTFSLNLMVEPLYLHGIDQHVGMENESWNTADLSILGSFTNITRSTIYDSAALSSRIVSQLDEYDLETNRIEFSYIQFGTHAVLDIPYAVVGLSDFSRFLELLNLSVAIQQDSALVLTRAGSENTGVLPTLYHGNLTYSVLASQTFDHVTSTLLERSWSFSWYDMISSVDIALVVSMEQFQEWFTTSPTAHFLFSIYLQHDNGYFRLVYDQHSDRYLTELELQMKNVLIEYNVQVNEVTGRIFTDNPSEIAHFLQTSVGIFQIFLLVFIVFFTPRVYLNIYLESLEKNIELFLTTRRWSVKWLFPLVEGAIATLMTLPLAFLVGFPALLGSFTLFSTKFGLLSPLSYITLELLSHLTMSIILFVLFLVESCILVSSLIVSRVGKKGIDQYSFIRKKFEFGLQGLLVIGATLIKWNVEVFGAATGILMGSLILLWIIETLRRVFSWLVTRLYGSPKSRRVPPVLLLFWMQAHQVKRKFWVLTLFMITFVALTLSTQSLLTSYATPMAAWANGGDFKVVEMHNYTTLSVTSISEMTMELNQIEGVLHVLPLVTLPSFDFGGMANSTIILVGTDWKMLQEYIPKGYFSSLFVEPLSTTEFPVNGCLLSSRFYPTSNLHVGDTLSIPYKTANSTLLAINATVINFLKMFPGYSSFDLLIVFSLSTLIPFLHEFHLNASVSYFIRLESYSRYNHVYRTLLQRGVTVIPAIENTMVIDAIYTYIYFPLIFTLLVASILLFASFSFSSMIDTRARRTLALFFVKHPRSVFKKYKLLEFLLFLGTSLFTLSLMTKLISFTLLSLIYFDAPVIAALGSMVPFWFFIFIFMAAISVAALGTFVDYFAFNSIDPYEELRFRE